MNEVHCDDVLDQLQSRLADERGFVAHDLARWRASTLEPDPFTLSDDARRRFALCRSPRRGVEFKQDLEDLAEYTGLDVDELEPFFRVLDARESHDAAEASDLSAHVSVSRPMSTSALTTEPAMGVRARLDPASLDGYVGSDDVPSDGRQIRTLVLAAVVALGFGALALGGPAVIGSSSDATTPQYEAPIFVPASEYAGDCPEPDPRPATQAEYDAIKPDIDAVFEQVREELAGTGFIRTTTMKLDGSGWVCGYIPDLAPWDIVKEPRAYDADLLAKVVFASPSFDGDILGYAFGENAYVSVEQIADPTFDREQLMMNRFGCVVNVIAPACPAGSED